MRELADRFSAMGKQARARVGADDLRQLRFLKRTSWFAELLGRLALQFITTPAGWLLGVLAVAYHLALEAQLNHTIMHGAYVGVPGAGRHVPSRYETLALPFQSKTWGDAHRIHHQHPSLLDGDPDTVHPLFRMHPTQAFRWWHRFNAFIGAFFTFEHWAFDYDAFLKQRGVRAQNDRGEWKKLGLHVAYNYLLFPALAGSRWWVVLLGCITAAVIRNLVFTALQTASSVGCEVSSRHALRADDPRGDERVRFQVETSKNFGLHGGWKLLCGGLDRHIEHHLWPHLPPSRLRELSPEVKQLCEQQGLRYQEFPTIWASLRDSVRWLSRNAR
jgi:linoleoyl-CoA desaturase